MPLKCTVDCIAFNFCKESQRVRSIGWLLSAGLRSNCNNSFFFSYTAWRLWQRSRRNKILRMANT